MARKNKERKYILTCHFKLQFKWNLLNSGRKERPPKISPLFYQQLNFSSNFNISHYCSFFARAFYSGRMLMIFLCAFSIPFLVSKFQRCCIFLEMIYSCWGQYCASMLYFKITHFFHSLSTSFFLAHFLPRTIKEIAVLAYSPWDTGAVKVLKKSCSHYSWDSVLVSSWNVICEPLPHSWTPLARTGLASLQVDLEEGLSTTALRGKEWAKRTSSCFLGYLISSPKESLNKIDKNWV